MQILIVDDDPDVRSSVAELVRLLGYEPLVAEGGMGALEIASHSAVDVALLDIEMPGMSGDEVARRLVLLRRQAIYMVAVTGRGSEADMQISASAGFLEHVVKPCTIRQLSGVLSRASAHLLGRKHASRPQPAPLQ